MGCKTKELSLDSSSDQEGVHACGLFMASLGVQSSVEHCSLGLAQILLLQRLGLPFLRKLEEFPVDHPPSHMAGFPPWLCCILHGL